MRWNELIERFDKDNMLKVLRDFPNQCIEALYEGKKLKLKKQKIENILVCGMGGSGIGGQIVKNLYKRDLMVPLDVNASYHLPAWVGKKTLVVLVSYSGNTEETISCFEEAKRIGAKTIAITSGGRLAKMCKQKVIIPAGLQPRTALGYLFVPIIPVFCSLGLLPESKAEELDKAVSSIRNERPHIEGKALVLVDKIKRKMPIFYAQGNYSAIAYRWQTQINENTKQLAHHQIIPELDHNEINSYARMPEKSVFVILRDRHEPARISERIELTKRFIHPRECHEVWIDGETLIERTLYAIHLGDLLSYYLALLYRQDPWSVPIITKLKAELKEKKE